ncbi:MULTISPECIES: undecaprenyl-phosphate glucose phosphotransferase [unclassified Aureimonas]|uniref:undecaprenyl-phosphate glucose phosphotransferase n=1 Tax=unclassified Aureimonas TaxID=2615206 RepID=UPI0006FEA3C6|nr:MULTISPECIES: undecaprenyl-phosphate glucose phosphotransferase [unclassified Aureimonas]KQT52986.1 undecaprenyl-phosphate glucose phosphotransferase [Aureimonas sp. Leaf427]KQT80443.1 undecaprenyl-phosphate glucose phosphotransferase [Aureimonas sp. Leaf460]
MDTIDGHLPFTPDAVRAFDGPLPHIGTGELNAYAAQAALQFKRKVMSPALLSGIWRIVEFMLLLSVAATIYVAHVAPVSPDHLRYLWPSVLGAGLGVAAIQLGQGYEIGFLRSRSRQVMRVTLAWGAALAVLAVVLFFAKVTDDVSRIWLASWFALGTVCLGIGRLVLSANIRRWARNGVMERRAVIVGGGQGAEALIRGLEMETDSDIRICGIFDDRGDRRSPPLVAGYPKLGNIRELVEFARLAHVDMLIVTLPLTAEKRVLSLLKQLWVLPLDIRLSAHATQLRFRPRSYSFIGDIPMLDVFDRPLADWDWIAKRIFDLVFASVAIVLLAPLMALAALAVKWDSKGPAIFRQKRHGFNNQVIEVLKFRSMFHEQSDPAAAKIVTKGDPRVTRVGRFIRKTSIDELPQLFNVILGQLSLVGPRPHAVYAKSSGNEAFVEIVDGYFGRHKVKPGITGLAQIEGYRGEIDEPEKLKKRVEYDLRYIENWSVLLDLKILFRTPLSLLKTEHAY